LDNFKIKASIEPTDKYLKAKMDLIQALHSYGELSPYEQECLIREIFGVANVATAYDILKNWGTR